MPSTQQRLFQIRRAFLAGLSCSPTTLDLNIPVQWFSIISEWFKDVFSRIHLSILRLEKNRAIYVHTIYLFLYIISLSIWALSKYLIVGWYSCLQVNLLIVIDSLYPHLENFGTRGMDDLGNPQPASRMHTILQLISAHNGLWRERLHNARGHFHLQHLHLYQQVCELWAKISPDFASTKQIMNRSLSAPVSLSSSPHRSGGAVPQPCWGNWKVSACKVGRLDCILPVCEMETPTRTQKQFVPLLKRPQVPFILPFPGHCLSCHSCSFH